MTTTEAAMGKPKHLRAVMEYAMETADSQQVEELQRLAARRFLLDLRSGRWEFRPGLPEFLIDTVQGLFCFSQGERLDGTPLRGQPMELMPWHLFSYYNIGGFFYPGTQIRRFTEANWFAPRKTVKTTAGEGLQTALAMYYRRSGAKAKTVAGSLKQGMEGFDWLVYNFRRLGLIAPNNPPGKLKLLDSSLGHSIEGDFWNGHIDLETLAFKPDLFDSFNANFVHLDELELYKNAIPYTRLRDGMKAYTNKLLLCTFTAGDDGLGFAAQHRDHMEKILRGTVTGVDADRTFCFLAQAPKQPDGEVDYLSPAVHRAANPAYNITIRPDDMMAAAQRAKENQTTRKEFLTRSLNVFVSSFKAWFDLDEFRRSDEHWQWSQEELAKLVKRWYGGADLSKLHDLTAACIVGEVPQKDAAAALKRWRAESPTGFAGAPFRQGGQDGNAEAWEPAEDVLCIVPHCWFPITAAAEKADQDQIPLFGWRDDGWLDMPNTASMDPTEPVGQFLKWRKAGFGIAKVGHDRKFARNYYTAMKKAGFRVKDQPQLYVQKSEGFRYIEHKAKIGCLCYLHAEPYEYCVSNVRAAEKVDDAIQYEKISPERRIDVFDASVFATVRMLIETERLSGAEGWFEEDKGERRHPIG
jgi:phage terminase large subunit-like protein